MKSLNQEPHETILKQDKQNLNVILYVYLCSLFFASEEWKQIMVNKITFPFIPTMWIIFSSDGYSSKSNIYKKESAEITQVCSDIQYG